MIKVLIVDDSAFMRSTIVRMLANSAEIEIVGQAKNGQEGLELAKKLRPDIITLDIEMPIMNGLDMLKELMHTNPTPVLMVSSLTTEGAEATFKALDLGALDFIPKYTDDSFSTKKLQEELCDKILHVSRRARYMRHKFAEQKKSTLQANSLNRSYSSNQQGSPVGARTAYTGSATKPVQTSQTTKTTQAGQSSQTSTKSSFSSTKSSSITGSSTNTFNHTRLSTESKTSSFDNKNPRERSTSSIGQANQEAQTLTLPCKKASRTLIGIGISTGGPPAVQEVLTKLPKNLPAAILIAQHMPASFTKPFAERLDKLCQIHVKEAEDGEQIQNGTAYIAPGGLHMSIQQRGALPYIKISQDPPTEIYKPSANVLFESLSNFATSAIGLIMTGMGSDGTIGLKSFKQKKGFIIAQNEDTCVVYGMPKAVIEEGIANEIKPLQDIPQAIIDAMYN